MAEGRISKRKDVTVLYETAVYSHLSRFETPIEVFLGDLRWDRGGGLELQYFGTDMLLVLLS
jgi:hypothetical protein